MPSDALSDWSTTRRRRIDVLVGLRRGITEGSVDARQIEWSIILSLASEFQGYCRDVHTETWTTLCRYISSPAPAFNTVLALAPRFERALDRSNATKESIRNDFRRIGVEDIWDDLKQGYAESDSWLHEMVRLNKVRNDIAHSSFEKWSDSGHPNYPMAVHHVLRSYDVVNSLVLALDEVLSAYVARTLDVARPW